MDRLRHWIRSLRRPRRDSLQSPPPPNSGGISSADQAIGFGRVLSEYYCEEQARAKRQNLGSRTVADEWGFRFLVVLTIVTYVLFFSVAIARITSPEVVVSYTSPPSGLEPIESDSSTGSRIYEFGGSVVHTIFHHHWFGFFAHYDHAPSSAKTTSTTPQDEVTLAPVLDKEPQQDLWYVGVILALIGTMVAAVGNHLVTLSHKVSVIEARETPGAPKFGLRELGRALIPSNRRGRKLVLRACLRPSVLFWLVGNVAITILGTVLTLTSFAFASQALLAPLSGLTIVWNALLATTKWFGNAILTKRDLIATTATLLGCVFIVVAGPRKTKHYTLDELIQMFSRMSFQAYSLFALICIVLLYRVSEGALYSLQQKRFAQGILPGLVGGFSNVLAKAAVELGSQRALFSSFTSLLIVIFAITAASCQLSWINKALSRFEPLFIVPVYQATLLLSSTLSGALYYGDFENLSLIQYCTFAFGVAGIVSGVTMLAGSAKTERKKTTSLPELSQTSRNRRKKAADVV